MASSSSRSQPVGNPPENLRIVFFLPMLDKLSANDWYSEPGIVPLMPKDLGELATAYLLPLNLIISSPLNKAGKVQKVFVHLGCGGLFEVNPKSSAFSDCSESRFKDLLRELLQKRQIVENGTNVIVAREIRTHKEVRAVYADLREHFYKVACQSGQYADNARRWAALQKEIAGHHSLLFLFGKHADFMRKEQLVDAYLKVSEYDLEHNASVGKVLAWIEQLFGIL